MPFIPTELSSQKCLYKIPGCSRTHGPPSYADNVYVIIFNALLSRKVIVNKGSTYTRDLICTYACSHPASADRDAAIYLPGY